jgi:hypothetical protein
MQGLTPQDACLILSIAGNSLISSIFAVKSTWPSKLGSFARFSPAMVAAMGSFARFSASCSGAMGSFARFRGGCHIPAVDLVHEVGRWPCDGPFGFVPDLCADPCYLSSCVEQPGSIWGIVAFRRLIQPMTRTVGLATLALASFRTCSQIPGTSYVASKESGRPSVVRNLRAIGVLRFRTTYRRQSPIR